ncbi:MULTISPECIES: hypothetical protein [unclassified Streptomyces]|uniref:hypothetical protein n=1 Tax=unclassified Streptomyces TaxID=2593676 RepID=UPI000CD52289|nr:hypothetical protein [Streptomyces sp. SM10]
MIKKIALALGLAAALTTVTAPVYAIDLYPEIKVQISQGTNACPDPSLCLYELPNFNASRDARVVILPAGLVWNLHSYGVGDDADSVYCTRQVWSCDLYDGTEKQGAKVVVPSGEALNTLSSAVATLPGGDRVIMDLRNRVSSTY